MKFKVAATDFDGTLYRNLKIPDDELWAIRNWRAAGNKFGIVTGRSFVMLERHLEEFKLEVDFAICCNGAIIHDKAGKVIFETEVPRKVLLELMNEPCANKSLHFAFEAADEVFYCRTNEQSWMFREYDKWSFALTKINDEQVATLPKKINQLALDFTTPEDTAQAAEIINRKYGAEIYAQKNTHSLDIVAAGINKAQGVESLLRVMNWQGARVFVIGDESNDLPMIRHFGGYTVYSAKDFVKREASEVFDSVGDMLNHFV